MTGILRVKKKNARTPEKEKIFLTLIVPHIIISVQEKHLQFTTECDIVMALTDTPWNKKLSQEEQKICHLVQNSHPAQEGEKTQSGGEAQTPTEKDRQPPV